MQRPFVTAGDMHVGRLARKAIYREYTDSTFTTLKPRPARVGAPRHHGPPPPRGGGRHHPRRSSATTRPSRPACTRTGCSTSRTPRGRPTPTGPAPPTQGDDGVAAGRDPRVHLAGAGAGRARATPRGAPRSGCTTPTPHEVDDVNAGLIGPMIVTARGMARADATPTDVDRELVVGVPGVRRDQQHALGGEPADVRQAAGRDQAGHRLRRAPVWPGVAVRLQGDDERLLVRQHAGAHDATRASGCAGT